MAARENQGLQIALIIFVMLTIVLAVTTYLGFDNWKQTKVSLEETNKKAELAESLAAKKTSERNELVEYLGHKAEDKHEDIMAKVGEALKAYSAFSEKKVQQTITDYSKLAAELNKALKAKDETINSLNDDNLKKDATYKEEVGKLDAAKKEVEANFATLQKKYTDNETEYKTNRTEWDKYKTDTNTQINELQAQLVAANDKVTNLQKQLVAKDKFYQDIVKQQRKEIEKIADPRPTLTDGKIVYVDERSHEAYVNIGFDDNLQRRVSFSVYSNETNDTASAQKKGAIEVIEVIGPKFAKARILENSVSDPIMPGDFIDSQLWYPGKQQKFAIAGLIDFDKDGVSDRAQLRDIISANGGVVVADVNEKGDFIGQITSDTASLILGTQPDDRSDPKLVKAWGDIKKDAQKFGIGEVNLDKFLDSVGYTPQSQSVATQPQSGATLIPGRPRLKDGSPDIVNPNFRPRVPPAAGKNGAF
ncbi:MAG: hypothetical protein SFX18_07620 [Pirellulales bacterium]|nr:hypothetical protein [Pirellulales bacterium]